ERDPTRAGGRVHEPGVVAHETEVGGRRLAPPEAEGPDGPLLDRALVGLAGAVVADRQRIRRHRTPSFPARPAAAPRPRGPGPPRSRKTCAGRRGPTQKKRRRRERLAGFA